MLGGGRETLPPPTPPPLWRRLPAALVACRPGRAPRIASAMIRVAVLSADGETVGSGLLYGPAMELRGEVGVPASVLRRAGLL
jgi:hypothetical protein